MSVLLDPADYANFFFFFFFFCIRQKTSLSLLELNEQRILPILESVYLDFVKSRSSPWGWLAGSWGTPETIYDATSSLTLNEKLPL